MALSQKEQYDLLGFLKRIQRIAENALPKDSTLTVRAKPHYSPTLEFLFTPNSGPDQALGEYSAYVLSERPGDGMSRSELPATKILKNIAGKAVPCESKEFTESRKNPLLALFKPERPVTVAASSANSSGSATVEDIGFDVS
ncbi:MAG: hypothetical protein VKK59_03680 [Vampirovibrionales bacterium]|nr:hypothetical protein [Vampirovibrionales bacterium]